MPIFPEPLPVGQVDSVVSAGVDGDAFEPRLTTHGFRYVRVEGHPGPLDVGDLTGAVAAQSEAVALGESAGSWFMVDAARAGLVESITKLASSEPRRLPETAATLRATIEAALQRRFARKA